MLADAMSRDGAFTCYEMATPLIKAAIKDKLPFMKRYLIYPGPPIHSTKTTLVRRAKDLAADVNYKMAFRKFCPPETSKNPQGDNAEAEEKKDGVTGEGAEEIIKRPFLPMFNPRNAAKQPFYNALQFLGMKEREFDKLTKEGKGGKKSVCESEYGIDTSRGPNEAQFVAFCKGVFDGGKPREVVIKFMSDKEQFKQETKVRDDLDKGDSEPSAMYVAPIYQSFDSTVETSLSLMFRKAIAADLFIGSSFELASFSFGAQQAMSNPESFKESYDTLYKYAIIIQAGDSDFGDILKQQNCDMNTKRMYLKMIGECLNYLHVNSLIHLDLKPQNIIRIRDRMFLIDLDAAQPPSSGAGKGRSFFGKLNEKISTGLFPPEMIMKFDGVAPKNIYELYFKTDPSEKEGAGDNEEEVEEPYYEYPWLEAKVKPKFSSLDKKKTSYATKIYKWNGTAIEDYNLTYKNSLIPVTKSLDFWAYGLLVYLAVTDTHFVQVTNKYDLANADSYKKILEWKDDLAEQIFTAEVPINPEGQPEAVELLMELLQKNPEKRCKPNQPGYFSSLLASNDFYQHKEVSSGADSPRRNQSMLMKTASVVNMDKFNSNSNGDEDNERLGYFKLFKRPSAEETDEESKERNSKARKILKEAQDEPEGKNAKKLVADLTAESRYPIHDAIIGKMETDVILDLIQLVGDTKNIPIDDNIPSTNPLHLALESFYDTQVILALVNETTAKDNDEYGGSMYALSVAVKRFADPLVIEKLIHTFPDALFNSECFEGNDDKMSPLHILVSRKFSNQAEFDVGKSIALTILRCEKEIIERRNGDAVARSLRLIEGKNKELLGLETIAKRMHNDVNPKHKELLEEEKAELERNHRKLQAEDEKDLWEIDLITPKKEKHSAAEKKALKDMRPYTWIIKKQLTTGRSGDTHDTPFMLCAKFLTCPEIMEVFVTRDAERDVSPQAMDRQIKTKDKFGNYPINNARMEFKKREKKGIGADEEEKTNGVMLALFRDFPVSEVLNKAMVKVLLTEVYGEISDSIRRGSIMDANQKGWKVAKKELPLKFALIWNSIIQYDEIGDFFLDEVNNFVLEKSGCDLFKANILAKARDGLGRKAVDVATLEIKKAIQDKLLFLKRYKFVPGPPIHKSATSIVVMADDMKAEDDYKATFEVIAGKEDDAILTKEEFHSSMKALGIGYDAQMALNKFNQFDVNGDGNMQVDEFIKFCKSELDNDGERKVVLKFMVEQDQWEREIKGRNEYNLDSQYIVDALEIFSSETHDELKVTVEDAKFFDKSLKNLEKDFWEYKHCIVMLGADRNLDTIYKCERPNINNIRDMMHTVGECLSHIHTKNLIHGDLKMMNVVRINGQLRLIDFDAAVKIRPDNAYSKQKFYVGAKFSSGVLAPELFCRIHGMKDKLDENHLPIKIDGVIQRDPHPEFLAFKDYFRTIRILKLDKDRTKQDDDMENKDVCAKLWEKVKPKPYKGDYLVVKSFRNETEINKKKRGSEQDKLTRLEWKQMEADMKLMGDSKEHIGVEREKFYERVKEGHESSLADPWSPLGGSPELPYELVECSETYDIWSFGVMLYHMVTGSQLFKCDRDDDLANAESIFDVLCWNEKRREEKLEAVKDELAKKVLSKLLEKDPVDRPQTMVEVLKFDFFDLKKNEDAETIMRTMSQRFDKQDETLEHLVDIGEQTLLNTHKIIELSFEMKDQISRTTSTILQGIFEATEVTTPTCFMILPYKLQSQVVENKKTGQMETCLRVASDGIEKAKMFMNQLDSLEESVQEATETFNAATSDPIAFGKKMIGSMKDKMLSKAEAIFDAKKSQTLYFYLIDEYTGEPVEGGAYPIKITTQSELCKKALPMMKLGMKAVSVFNGAAGIATMCGFPVPQVPSSLSKMAKKSIKNADQDSSVAEFSVVQEVVDSATGEDSDGKGKSSGPKRGGALREFMKFLDEHDPEKNYAGLARICQEQKQPDGSIKPVAIWTTDDGKTKLEHEQVRQNTAGEEKKKYDDKLKKKMAKRKAKNMNSPSKAARMKARGQMGLLQEEGGDFEDGSPMAKTPTRNNLLEPLEVSPFKRQHDEEMLHLNELQQTVEGLANMKVTGTVMEGELYCKKSSMMGLSSSNKPVMGKIRGDGILTYDNYYIDLANRDLYVNDGGKPGTGVFEIKDGKGVVRFSVKDKNFTAEQWIEAIRSWDTDGKLTSDFEAKKQETIEKIEAMKSKALSNHGESSKMVLEMVAHDSDEEVESDEEGEKAEEEEIDYFAESKTIKAKLPTKIQEKFDAAAENDKEEVKEDAASLTLEDNTEWKDKELLELCSNEHYDDVRRRLRQKVAEMEEFHQQDKKGFTPLHFALKHCIPAEDIRLLIEYRKEMGIDEDGDGIDDGLQAHGRGDILAIKTNNGGIPMHVAAKYASDPAVLEILYEKHPESLTEVDEKKKTVLEKAKSNKANPSIKEWVEKKLAETEERYDREASEMYSPQMSSQPSQMSSQLAETDKA